MWWAVVLFTYHISPPFATSHHYINRFESKLVNSNWTRVCCVFSLAVSLISLILFCYLHRFLMHCCTDCPFQLRDSWMSSSCIAVAWFSKCPGTFIETVFECHPLKYSPSNSTAPLLPNLSPFFTRHLSTIFSDKPSSLSLPRPKKTTQSTYFTGAHQHHLRSLVIMSIYSFITSVLSLPQSSLWKGGGHVVGGVYPRRVEWRTAPVPRRERDRSGDHNTMRWN